MNEDFLSIKEFAQKMHMHYNTIYRAVKKGRIQGFRVGASHKGSFRIPLSEIQRIAIIDFEDILEKELKKRSTNQPEVIWEKEKK